MATKLTKGVVEKIQPGERDVFLWDSTITGLGVRVLPSGKRSFLLQYRNAEGRSRRITIRRFGVLTVQQAREKAIRLLAEVSDGGDPAQQRRDTSEAPVLSELVARYVSDRLPKRKARSAREYRRLIEKHILPALGSRKVAHITITDVERLHMSMESTPTQANRTVAVLSVLFRLAEKWGMRPVGSSPTSGIERFPESKRERFLSMSEFEQLGKRMREMEVEGELSTSAVAAFRLVDPNWCSTKRDSVSSMGGCRPGASGSGAQGLEDGPEVDSAQRSCRAGSRGLGTAE
jgi:hypothetical protein